MVPLTKCTQSYALEFPLIWATDSVKYLGVWVHQDLEIVIRENYGVAYTTLEQQIDKWVKLPLSLADRIALIKMVELPKFLYLFCNIPIPLTQHFKTLRSLLLRLIWGGKHARVSWEVLTLDYKGGGFSVSDLYLYYLCAHAHYAHYWVNDHDFIPHIAVEDGDAHPILLSSILTHTRRYTPRTEINTIDTTVAAWQTLGRLAGKLPLYSPLLPLAFHSALSVTHDRGAMHTLKLARFALMMDLYVDGVFVSDDDLNYIQNKTQLFIFLFHRLKKSDASALFHFPC